MDNTLQAILFKTYEQYYTPNFTSVPIYIEHENGKYRPKYALANDCNRFPLYYWSDEQHELKIGYLLDHKRIESLINKPVGQQETFAYSFNHIKDEKVYFYSATREELLEDPELMKVFLAYGARKASWRMYKIQLTDMQMEQAHIPLSIPDSINEAVKRQNQPPPPRLLARLKRLSHIALVTDITEEQLSSAYELLPIKRDDIIKLKVFAHPRNKPPAPISMFRFKYHNQRKETRYQLRTKVQVKIDDLVLEGASEDVSVRGMRIELHSFFHDVENVEVKVSFPQLQKVTQKYELIDLPYRVKGISADRNVLHLQAINDLVNTTAQRFFDELIRKNRSRLKAYREEEEIPGIGSALRNLYAQNVLNTAFFIKKEGVELVPDAVATSQRTTRIQHMLGYEAEPGRNNLHFLYSNNENESDFISSVLKSIKANRSPVMRELYVAFNPSKSIKDGAFDSVFADQFKTHKERHAFIAKALKRGQFIAVKVFIARTGRPDTELSLIHI